MTNVTRRGFMALSASGLAGAACATNLVSTNFDWRPAERDLIAAVGADFDLVVRGTGNQMLRARAREVPPNVELGAVAQRMERTMRDAEGVGLAGPQVGLGLRVAMLLLDYKTDHPTPLFVQNPVILERSDDSIEGYEGCLSIPNVGGLVRRNRWLRVQYMTLAGIVETQELERHNAVLWQHELDHLDGLLYVDKVLGDLLPMDEVRRLRSEAEGAISCRDNWEGAAWLVG